MPLSAVVAGTPYYVLMDGNRRIGPKVVPPHSGIQCVPIYGFSDKCSYDRFCMNGQLALTPYPLVALYLSNQVGVPGDGLKLVVLDAAGPREPFLHAAKMEAVLDAHQNRTTHVTAAYLLVFDPQSDTYQVDESPE
jgi:hypothetical protein